MSEEFESLYMEYKTDVFRFALSIVKNYSDAQDITSDVFYKVLQKHKNLHEQLKVKTWILKITKNTSLDYLRKRVVQDEKLINFNENDEINVYQKIEFLEMLEILDNIDRQVVTLYIVNRLQHKEIAEVLSISYSAVRKRYSRSLDKLRTQLEGDGLNEQQLY